MKKYLYLLLTLLYTYTVCTAQPIPPASIEDSVLGWMKVYNFKGAKEGMKVDHRVYSKAQLSICDSFANWIQASYIPKGGWGDVKKSVGEKLGLYNKHTAAMPNSYGAYSKTYYELKYNKGKKELYTSEHIWWGIAANAIPGWAIRSICRPDQYYFTMPTAETEEANESMRKLLDISKVPSIKPYISFWIHNEGFGQGSERVLLCNDNKSPFVVITKGEYLQALELAIPLYYEKEKKRISEAEQGNQQRIAVAMKSVDERIARFKEGLKNNKEKYKNRLSEPAMTSKQHGLDDLDGRDAFGGQYLTDAEPTSTRYPVYKVDPVMAELCKSDKPQWILIGWDYYPGGKDFVQQQQHEAIINNFNFEYVYNFFFAPEKVKGQAYKPLRSPAFKETIQTGEVSQQTIQNSKDKSIYFFEDFSSSAIGKKPIDWKSSMALAASSVVTKLDGLEGNWTEIGDHKISPLKLKMPLPQDFTLSYDLVVRQNFTWGAKGLALQLSREGTPGNAESFLVLRLRPGFDGRDGEVMLETKFPYPPGYSNGSKWFAATGFSNNKKYNRITVTIKKKDAMLQVFIDKNKIVEYEKAIPDAHLFNAMSFTGANSGEGDRYYITNVKVTKD